MILILFCCFSNVTRIIGLSKLSLHFKPSSRLVNINKTVKHVSVIFFNDLYLKCIKYLELYCGNVKKKIFELTYKLLFLIVITCILNHRFKFLSLDQ